SPSRSVSSTLTCSQRSSARAVATAAANVNTNSQQRRASKPATRPDSTLFMFVTSPLKTYCGNEKPLPEVPNIFNRGSGIWDLESGVWTLASRQGSSWRAGCGEVSRQPASGGENHTLFEFD